MSFPHAEIDNSMYLRSPPRLLSAARVHDIMDEINLPPPLIETTEDYPALQYVPLNISYPQTQQEIRHQVLPPPIITTQIGNLTVQENVPRYQMEQNRPHNPAFRAEISLVSSFERLQVGITDSEQTETSTQES